MFLWRYYVDCDGACLSLLCCSLMAEASAIDASPFVAAFSSAASACYTMAPAASAASLAVRPKVATMSACMISCAYAACCSVAALCLAFSSWHLLSFNLPFCFMFQLL